MANCPKCGIELPPSGVCRRCAAARPSLHDAPTMIGPTPTRPGERNLTPAAELPWVESGRGPYPSPPEAITTGDIELLEDEDLAERRSRYSEPSDVASLDDVPTPAHGLEAPDLSDEPTPVVSSDSFRAARAAASKPQAAAKARSRPLDPEPQTGGGTQVAAPGALWRRLLAAAVDFTLVGAVVALYFLIASAIVGAKAPRAVGGLDGLVMLMHAWHKVLAPGVVLAVLLALAYSAVFAALWDGRSPGRFLLGLRLVDQSGLPPAPARAVIRAVLGLLSAALFLGGFWLALFDRKGQTLHDKLTSTFVVRLKRAHP